MVSLTVVILTFAIIFTGLWFVFRFSAGGELRKQPYKRTPAHHAHDKKGRA